MSDNQRRDWTDKDDKRAAIRDVLRHILSQNDDEYAQMSDHCLGDNQFAQQLFVDIGQIDPPTGAKVVFLPAKDDGKESGSLLLEPPPKQADSMSDKDLLDAYMRSDYALPPRSSSPQRNWGDLSDRAAAILDVLRYVATTAGEGDKCLADDGYARGLFTSPTLGKIQPPTAVKIVFMPPGQIQMEAGGSLGAKYPNCQTEGHGPRKS